MENEPKKSPWNSPENLTRVAMAGLTGMAVGAALPVATVTIPLVGAISMATLAGVIFGVGAHYGIKKSELE